MYPKQRAETQVGLHVFLREWETKDAVAQPNGWSFAEDIDAQAAAAALRDKLNIRLGLKGLEIETTSFVGRVVVGPLTITVRPKLPDVPLARLLRYAYELRDISTFEHAPAPTSEHGFHDLLVELLAAEAEELLHRGLTKVYISLADRLESPRGRIDIQEIGRRGGIHDAALPCRYQKRHDDWSLNRILCAGLRYAANVTGDRDLRRRVHQLVARFGDIGEMTRLTARDVDRVEQGLTRLTAAYRPALVVVRLLLQMQGVDAAAHSVPAGTLGYLFDMNVFYQRLLSRFFHTNLVGRTIHDEYSLRYIFAYAPSGNPRRQTAPSPRPDYALFDANGLRGFLDAKYRDLWEKRGVPPDWLYQLSIYALASPSQKSALLYATMAEDAVDEQIDIRNPASTPGQVLASVLLRPVNLNYLAELVGSSNSHQLTAARQEYAKQLSLLRE